MHDLPHPAGPPRPLFSLFPHARGPVEPCRTVSLADLSEWPDLWAADPRVLAAVGDRPGRLRYFAATDSEHPDVPLLAAGPDAVAEPANIRDKVWQRRFVEGTGLLPQPGFAAVTGTRIESSNAPWRVRVGAVDCRPARASLLAAAAPGAVVVVEDAETGFVAVVRGDGVRLVTRSPHVAALFGGATEYTLPAAGWARFVDALCARPLPLGITKAAFNPSADLGDALSRAPGSYILKPRHGSNGFGVVRVVSHADGSLTAETDCPDTARYLDEFPADPGRRGRDVVAAAAGHRARYADRATAGLSERAMNLSILEDEIRQDRAEGSLFEPRVVVQRVRAGAGEAFAVIGAVCKRIDTAVGASVARDFGEEPLEVSLHRFLGAHAPGPDLAGRVRATRAAILAAGDELRAAVVPVVEASGARVHQFGIDCRLCWNPALGRVEYPFLEFQFGIGRIDPPALAAGYKTPAELRAVFGPEVG